MKSGNIKLNNKSYPLTWTGETAEHLADGFINYNHIHPYLHIKAQQFARMGIVEQKTNKRFLSYYHVEGNTYVVVPLLLQNTFVVICSCFLKNISNFNTQKHRVGAVKNKSKVKKEKIALEDITFTDQEKKSIEVFGFTVKDYQKGLFNVINGYTRKKR